MRVCQCLRDQFKPRRRHLSALGLHDPQLPGGRTDVDAPQPQRRLESERVSQAVDPQDSDRPEQCGRHLCRSEGDGLYRSLDFGANWTKISAVPTPTGSGILILAVWRNGGSTSGRSSNIACLSEGNGVYVETAGGTTFAQASGTNMPTIGGAIEYTAGGKLLVANTSGTNIARRNAGAWTLPTVNAWGFVCHPTDATKVWAQFNGEIRYSTTKVPLSATAPVFPSGMEETSAGTAGPMRTAWVGRGVNGIPPIARSSSLRASGLGKLRLSRCVANPPQEPRQPAGQFADLDLDQRRDRSMVTSHLNIEPTTGDVLMSMHDRIGMQQTRANLTKAYPATHLNIKPHTIGPGTGAESWGLIITHGSPIGVALDNPQWRAVQTNARTYYTSNAFATEPTRTAVDSGAYVGDLIVRNTGEILSSARRTTARAIRLILAPHGKIGFRICGKRCDGDREELRRIYVQSADLRPRRHQRRPLLHLQRLNRQLERQRSRLYPAPGRGACRLGKPPGSAKARSSLRSLPRTTTAPTPFQQPGLLQRQREPCRARADTCSGIPTTDKAGSAPAPFHQRRRCELERGRPELAAVAANPLLCSYDVAFGITLPGKTYPVLFFALDMYRLATQATSEGLADKQRTNLIMVQDFDPANPHLCTPEPITLQGAPLHANGLLGAGDSIARGPIVPTSWSPTATVGRLPCVTRTRRRRVEAGGDATHHRLRQSQAALMPTCLAREWRQSLAGFPTE